MIIKVVLDKFFITPFGGSREKTLKNWPNCLPSDCASTGVEHFATEENI
jgi:hypothetical protein